MRYYEGKKVLVPGGAGFVGSHLVARLLGLGAEVAVLDNFLTGARHNLAGFEALGAFRLIEGDIIAPILPEAEIIFNLACPASPKHYQQHPIETLKASVFGADNLARHCASSGARLVHSSTSEVYGDPLFHPQKEAHWGNVNPVGPRACYDEGKRAAEALLMDYHRVRGIDVRIARIFNTYGPKMARGDGRVVSNFIVQALAGEDITIFGDGSATRSFCYVDDMIDALLALGACKGASGEIVNLGNPGEFTILELAKKVLAQVGGASEMRFCTLPEDDPVRRRPDIGKANKMLGWQPAVGLDAGLARTIDYFR